MTDDLAAGLRAIADAGGSRETIKLRLEELMGEPWASSIDGENRKLARLYTLILREADWFPKQIAAYLVERFGFKESTVKRYSTETHRDADPLFATMTQSEKDSILADIRTQIESTQTAVG